MNDDNDIYAIESKILKAISDENRLKIIDLLSNGEMCACDILKYFNFSQPTLSHHMKVLLDCKIINCKKEGTSNKYTLDIKNLNNLILFLMKTITDTESYGDTKIFSSIIPPNA